MACWGTGDRFNFCGKKKNFLGFLPTVFFMARKKYKFGANKFGFWRERKIIWREKYFARYNIYQPDEVISTERSSSNQWLTQLTV